MAYHKGFKLSKTGLSIPHLHINRFVKKLQSDNGNEISSNDMNTTNIHSWHHGLLFPVVLGLLFACGTNAAVFANIPVTSLAFWAQALLFSLLFMLTFRCCDKLPGSPAGPARRAIEMIRRNAAGLPTRADGIFAHVHCMTALPACRCVLA